MRALQLHEDGSGRIINIIVVDSLNIFPRLVDAAIYPTATIGDSIVNSILVPKPIQPAPVPEAVTPLQGLLALDQAGMATAYDAWAKNPARTFSERAFIEKAQTWRRDNAVLQGACAGLGITPTQLDDLFKLAATL